MSSAVPPRNTAGATAVGDGARKRRPWWLMILLLLLGLAALALLLSRCSTDDDDDAGVATGELPAATAPATLTPSASAALPTVGAGESATASGGAAADPSSASGSGQLVAGTTDLLAGAANGTASLSAYSGQSAKGTDVVVESVPADEGFWVGTSTESRVWVQLNGSGESGYQVKQGDHVDFTGSTVKNPTGFAAKVGVSDPEGAAQLTAQGVHMLVDKSTLALHK